MSCERCDGLMVLDRFDDPRSSELWLCAWRCANCGNVVDDQIRRHRVEPPTLYRGRHAVIRILDDRPRDATMGGDR